MSYVTSLIALIFINSFVNGINTSTYGSNVSSNTVCDKIITLNEDNFIIIRGGIHETTAAKAVQKLLELTSNDIYIYLSTPGGSVFAGLSVVQAMQTLQKAGKRIYTIGDFAASMGYIIHQYGTQRYVRSSGVLMQHQMSYGVHGNYQNVKSFHKFIGKVNSDLNQYQAQRCGVTPEQFESMTQHDMWLFGSESVNLNVSDCVVDVECKFHTETYTEEIYTWWGPVELTWSTCPLISGPLKVRFTDSSINLNDSISHIPEIISRYDRKTFFNTAMAQNEGIETIDY